MRRDVPDRRDGVPRPAAMIVGALLATMTLTAAIAAPAGAKPDKERTTDSSRPAQAPGRSQAGGVVETAPETSTDQTAAPVPVPTLRRAALRIVVNTTSDWVQVDLPGVSAGHVTVSGDRQVRPTDRGVVVSGPLRVAGSAIVDVVTEVSPELADVPVAVTQGGVGRSTVQILNRTTDVREVLSMTTDWATTRQWVTLTSEALMGPEQLEWTRADDQRRVLAFTYPWFGEWATTDARLSVHPTDPWITPSYDSALLQADRARAHGVDGFVMSFAGGAKHGLPLYHSLAAAAATGGTATILLETGAASSAAEAEQWLVQALRQSSSPAFMRLDGVPVVFAFATGTVPASEWEAIGERLAAAGTPVKIISDTWSPDSPSAGLYRYNALLQEPTDPMTTAELTEWNQVVSRRLRASATLGVGDPGVVVATVQPGWHRFNSVEGEMPIARDGTATLDGTWQAALAAEPDWVVVTSWNEWYEGTGIAPSAEHGTTSLEATKPWVDLFRS